MTFRIGVDHHSPHELLIIMQHIVSDANLTEAIEWLPLPENTAQDRMITGEIDCTSDFWVNTQQRLHANLTFTYPLMPVELVFVIPDPERHWWPSAPLAVFRVFSIQFWSMIMLILATFVASIQLMNTFTKWMRFVIDYVKLVFTCYSLNFLTVETAVDLSLMINN